MYDEEAEHVVHVKVLGTWFHFKYWYEKGHAVVEVEPVKKSIFDISGNPQKGDANENNCT